MILQHTPGLVASPPARDNLKVARSGHSPFPFSEAGSDVVESAVILMEFVAAPHERWAELAKRMHDTEHAGDDTTKGETS